MAGTGYRTPLPEFKEVSGPKQWSKKKCLIARASDCVLGKFPTPPGLKGN